MRHYYNTVKPAGIKNYIECFKFLNIFSEKNSDLSAVRTFLSEMCDVFLG